MVVAVRAEVDARDMARVVRVLRNIDKDLVTELRTSMKSGIMPIARGIESRVNSTPAPMSGMMREGRSRPNRYRWAKAKASVSITPGYSRRSSNLVTIKYAVPKDRAGLAIAENAGSKSRGTTPQAQFFIRRIEQVSPGWPHGGRFLYRAFMPYKPAVYGLAENILKRWIAKTNRELEAR